eukprot:6214026-Pleurochrysis_carterae.AAC.3
MATLSADRPDGTQPAHRRPKAHTHSFGHTKTNERSHLFLRRSRIPRQARRGFHSFFVQNRPHIAQLPPHPSPSPPHLPTAPHAHTTCATTSDTLPILDPLVRAHRVAP